MKRRDILLWVGLSFVVSLACAQQDSVAVHVMFLGDVNLGRRVGQAILKGDTSYPFVNVADRLRAADLTFANLESPLTDQGGETQHPKYNLIFCGPVAGAWTLAQSGIDVVSTANNHAFDYGIKGLRETVGSLQAADVKFTGTGIDGADADEPVLVNIAGIQVGIVAFTEFVNLKGNWSGRIAVYDSARAAIVVNRLRQEVDVVIASYHGGDEYVDRPRAKTLKNLRDLAAAGADIVVGHHPHVPQGVEKWGTSLIFYSLGNFVFYQPQHYWTQIGFAAEVTIGKRNGIPVIQDAVLRPATVGLQPTWDVTEGALDSLEQRLQSTSLLLIRREHNLFKVDIAN